MPNSASRFGLSAAISTPFDSDMRPDTHRLIAHARNLLAKGCDSITLFGTTGEGASLGDGERGSMLAACASAGFDFRRQVIAGIATSACEHAVMQARTALDANCKALLVAPPFYFKAVSDDAVFAWYAEFFKRLGAEARDVILYHLPSLTCVPISIGLIGRLKAAFPKIVLGVKDSSGDGAHTSALLAAHRDLVILVGDERHLAKAMRDGACGAICGMANLETQRMRAMIDTGANDQRICDLVDAVTALPVMAAVKTLIAHRAKDPGWAVMRPPLDALDARQSAGIVAAYDRIMGVRAA